MKKILLMIPYGSVGGMERLALTFYDYYKSKGYIVKGLKIIKLNNDIISFGDDEIYLSNKDFNEMSRFQRMIFYLKCPFLINRLVKKYEISHSIAFGDMANLFSSLSFSKEFKVGSIHALKSSEFSGLSTFNKIFKLSYKSTYYFLDKVVCISKGIKDDLIENCSFKFKNKLIVIYNPHNIKRIRELANDSILDMEESILFQGQVILFLGRVSIQKAPWHLLKAFKDVLLKFPKAKLVFLGAGQVEVIDYLNNLIADYKLQENIIFLGRKSNPYKYLKKAKVLALSSYYEGTPNVIIEAMALETPIVTTNCTDGIGELMGLKNNEKYKLKNIKTEVGFITPSVFRGDLNIPEDKLCTIEEKLIAEAISDVLNNDFCYKNSSEVDKLLSKFNLNLIAKDYLLKLNK
ncbi:glycosyltransferase [Lutibacter sp. A80]|uniref:glycosyltransferase n=1 Tax=Lutibacter sp. A80 TaxID=2918453 RepID=UPI001F058A9C|nr:glycosyltransferase [Lutibacter sp. A80]UMB60343.1 glycosyltransferase [Lutibacter sp. A80]